MCLIQKCLERPLDVFLSIDRYSPEEGQDAWQITYTLLHSA